MGAFQDGVRSFANRLANTRNPVNENGIVSPVLQPETMRQLYRNGLGNKIIRLKSGHALNDTIQFASEQDRQYYAARLDKHVKKAAKWMLAFGRGIVVLHHKGDDLKTPLGSVDASRVMFSVFSGDMVTPTSVDRDLQSPRYLLPEMYTVRGATIHHSRAIDFRYVEPPELDAPNYRYGGISEFELIYEQIIADGVVQRASPQILEKASSLFYKIKGFKDAMRSGQESAMVEYFQQLESVRGLFAAGLVDSEDELEVISQNISNLAEADQITLRRLAMVTGIPLALLVGENVKGLNSTGENERQAFQDMIESLQSDYLLDPINQLMRKLGQGDIEFKENQGDTPQIRIAYDEKAIANALALSSMGEDGRTYLIDRGVITQDEFDVFFPPVEDDDLITEEPQGDETGA